ncbi:DUF397 domain-containing protein [Kitasatospora sp. NPDC101801]|uniref:DUF397 domain-containing protein n=1 Tax=Kitasatospora sp. NPDC101801 TaxID=3364103 RepID=UPI00380FB053
MAGKGGAVAQGHGPKPELDLTGAEWLGCDPDDLQGNGAVQVAFVGEYIVMRDGRAPDGPALVFTPAEWRAFVLGTRDGELGSRVGGSDAN